MSCRLTITQDTLRLRERVDAFKEGNPRGPKRSTMSITLLLPRLVEEDVEQYSKSFKRAGEKAARFGWIVEEQQDF